MKRVLTIVLVLLGTAVFAQTPATKKELVAKVLQVQQPGIEALGRALAEQPAAILMQRAGNVMQTRTPPDKREAIARDIQADVKKYADDVMPLMRDRAAKLAPSTIGTLLDERFTEDELKQLIVILESPVNRKFQQLGGEMQKALSDKLVAETKGLMEPKIKALELSISNRLGLPNETPAPAAAGAARPPAKPASN